MSIRKVMPVKTGIHPGLPLSNDRFKASFVEFCRSYVATRKDPKLVVLKFLVVGNVDADLRPLGHYSIAVDTVGAGLGNVVLHVARSSARMTEQTGDRPVDACIMAIVDALEIDGTYTYEKHRAEAAR